MQNRHVKPCKRRRHIVLQYDKRHAVWTVRCQRHCIPSAAETPHHAIRHVARAGARYNFDSAAATPAQRARALVEGQVLAMKAHSAWIGDHARSLNGQSAAAVAE